MASWLKVFGKGSHGSITVADEGHYKEFYGYPIRTKFFTELSRD